MFTNSKVSAMEADNNSQYTRSNKTMSRSCPTRAVDENLSIRLSISGAFERVRITSTFGNRKSHEAFWKGQVLASMLIIANVIQYASEAELVHRKGALTDERVSNGERMVLRKLPQGAIQK